MSNHSATLGLVLWLGAVPLLMWAGLDGPALAGVVGTGWFLIGAVLVTQWMVAGGMPPMSVR